MVWFKELVVLDGVREVARLTTKGADHGPKATVLVPNALASPVLRLELHKAGFLGVRTHGYTRCLDVAWCKGRAVSLLWARERFSSNDQS